MKLCVDCKHYVCSYEGDHICTVNRSPVDGRVIPRACEKQRANVTVTKIGPVEKISGCGPDGNMWEAK
jgi:hypothetical protein